MVIPTPTERVETDARQDVFPCPLNCPCRCEIESLFKVRFITFHPLTEPDFVVGLRHGVRKHKCVAGEMRVPRHAHAYHDKKGNQENAELCDEWAKLLCFRARFYKMIECQPGSHHAEHHRREGPRIERVSQSEPRQYRIPEPQ